MTFLASAVSYGQVSVATLANIIAGARRPDAVEDGVDDVVVGLQVLDQQAAVVTKYYSDAAEPLGGVRVSEFGASTERSRAVLQIVLATTGVAGPKPDEDGNPVGLFHVAVVAKG